MSRNIFAVAFAFGLMGAGFVFVILMFGVIWLAAHGWGVFILLVLPLTALFFIGRALWTEPDTQSGLAWIAERWNAWRGKWSPPHG